MRRFGAGGLASLALTAATVVLVGWPVVAGFWTTSPLEMVMSQHPNARIVDCLDLRVPGNIDKVRHLSQPKLQRYVVDCNLTYTKDCSRSSTTPLDPKTGQPIGPAQSSAYICEIRDKQGNVVRTYTTDTTLGSTALKVFTPQPGSQAEHDLKTTGTLNPRYAPLPYRTRPTP